MSLNELAAKCHAVAIEKGWYARERTFTDLALLLHTEVSEAVEDWREGLAPNEERWDWDKTLRNAIGNDVPKPCGIPSELADLIIRTLDMCAFFEINIDKAIEDKMRYNELRPIRHGGKRI